MAVKITPVPQRMEPRPGAFSVGDSLQVRCTAVRGKAGGADRENTLRLLLEGLKRKTAREPKMRRDLRAPHCLEIAQAGSAAKPAGRTRTAPPNKTEGYALTVEPGRIRIVGRDQAGLFYGVQTFLQILRKSRDGIPCMTIEDWPDIAFRAFGAFVGLWEYDKDRTGERYCRLAELAAAHKFNHIAFHDESAWTKSGNNTLSDDALREFGQCCRRNFLEPVPVHLFLCYSRKNVVKYVAASDEEFSKLMEPADRVIRLLNPKIFCISADELVSTYDVAKRRSIYSAAQRKKHAPHEWLLLCLKRFNNYFRERDIQMAMGADSLIDGEASWGFPCILQDYGGAPDCHYRMVASLPKDIMMWDWHYEPAHVYPTMDYLQEKGFPTVGCPWCDPWNPEMYTEYAFHTRTKCFVGMMPLAWAKNWDWRSLKTTIARQGDCIWSVGKYAAEPAALRAYRKIIRENPLLNIQPGRRRIEIAPDALTDGRKFLAWSQGAKSVKVLQEGLGTKSDRALEVRYKVQAAPGCSFDQCRLTLSSNPVYAGHVAISQRGKRFTKVADLKRSGKTQINLTARVKGKNAFFLSLRGTNHSKLQSYFVNGFEVDCCVSGGGSS